jgi:glutamate-1-semialdehyde 2,1-aminomutase
MDKTEKLISLLESRYRKKTRKSLRLYQEAQKVMVRGGSHSIRLFSPYPFFMASAAGPCVHDLDGNAFIDYWQGHYANVLGHNPDVLKAEFRRFDPERGSLHTGFEGESQVRLAELILSRLGYKDHKIRFTTSGALATMSAVMLAQAHTRREKILKIGGGWHGATPYLLKGVNFHGEDGFGRAESAGIPEAMLRNTLITRYNDIDRLERIFKKQGDRIAAFIVEPFLGVGGFIAATRDYLRVARRLTARYGALLIFDEIISGFRFCPSGLQTLYGVEPDITTFGKLIGGGHAVSAVEGKARILEGRNAKGKVKAKFEGGTFSSHPQYMRAGYVMLKHLVDHAGPIYGALAAAGDSLRTRVEAVFRAEGIEARCTGWGNEAVPGSSLFMVNFPRTDKAFTSAEDVWDPARCDVRLKEEILKIALLAEDVNVVHGGGAISLAHGPSHLDRTVEAYAAAAHLFKKYLF